MESIDIRSIKAKFQQPLPGLSAQLRMAPAKRREELELVDNLKNARESAVMIILFEKESVLHAVFILRSDYDGIHSGQMAFPGGKKEPEDMDSLSTAIREVKEEIGLDAQDYQVLAQLSDLYIPPSNFLIKVFVAFYPGVPVYNFSTNEVKSLIEVPLTHLADPINVEVGAFRVNTNDMIVDAPYYKINELKLWGATAMITSELLEILA